MGLSFIKVQSVPTPAGEVVVGENDGRLCLCVWARHGKRTAIEHRLQRLLKKKFADIGSPLLDEAAKQIREYLTHQRTCFSIETELVGSAFQQAVWRKVAETGYGQTITFKQLAGELGIEDAIRPMAAAISSNPLSLFVPCHRIVGGTKSAATSYEDKLGEKLREAEAAGETGK